MPSLNIIGNINQSVNPNIAYFTPFYAIGGIKETFVTGGISYTMHSFISGSGSFEILQGETQAQVLVIGGGGAGNNGDGSNRMASGGGAGGVLYFTEALRKSQIYGVRSIYNAYIGSGGIAKMPDDGLPATGSTWVRTYDAYYTPITASVAFKGGNANNAAQNLEISSGSSGGGFKGQAYPGIGQGNNGGTVAYSGGGGYSTTGSNPYTVPAVGNFAGNGGLGIDLPYYFGGPSGSYPLKLAGGGGGGGNYQYNAIPYYELPAGSGSYGGGNGGNQSNLSGSNGTVNTGGGGGGGFSLLSGNPSSGNTFGPGGNGGSGVIRVVYQTQFTQ
jgi:hypothetical protein